MREGIERWGRSGIFVLVFAVLLGGFLRFYDIGGESFSDDEVFKVNAVNLYRQGQWTQTADDEHPMVMKLCIYASWAARDLWNGAFAAGPDKRWEVGLESATRAPNALIGALDALLIALLVRELFGRRVALIAALFYAVEVNIVGFNRIAKEDTLLMNFLMALLYFVLRAKRSAEEGDVARSRRFELSGAVMLGLMLASKYFINYAIVPVGFYFWTRARGQRAWTMSWKRFATLGVVGAVTFFAVNPTLLSPANLRYIVGYIQHKTVFTHGYLFLGDLYMNNVFEGVKGSGTPWYFYFVFLGVKTALPFVVASLVGVAVLIQRRQSDAARLFAVWFGLFFVIEAVLVGTKFTRYIMHILPLYVMVAALGTDAIARAIEGVLAGGGKRVLQYSALALTLGASASAALACQKTAPHYRMYLNALGGDQQNLRRYFPHCDFYDVGVREAVEYVCARAEPNAQLRTDSNVVSLHYVRHLCKRDDILVTTLSEPTSGCRPDRACYHLLQVGRTFYETEKLFADLHASRPPDAIVKVDHINVAEVYGPERAPKASVSIFTAGEAVAAGALERHPSIKSGPRTAWRMSKDTFVEETLRVPIAEVATPRQ